MMRGEPSTSKAQVTWHTACLAVAANTSYAPYIDKHAVKQFVRQQAPTLRLAATVEYWSNASDGSLATLAWRPVPSGVTELVLKASHLSGGVMLVRENATTCIKAPCRTGVGSRVLEAGTVLVGNQRARMALEASCRLWLAYSYGNHKVRLGTWSERPLYSNVPRGCLLEEAIERDLHGQKDIKVFCFAQQPAFVMVRPINRRFTRNATTAGGSSRGRGKDPEESIAYYTTGWRQLRMYEGHARAEGHVEGHARRAVVVEGHARPPYLQSLLDDATRLARGGGFDSVRVDFLASRDRYAFNELTFSHRGCAGGTFVPEPLDLLYGSLASAGPRGLEVEGSGGGGGGGGSIEEEQLRIIAEHERTHRWHCEVLQHLATGLAADDDRRPYIYAQSISTSTQIKSIRMSIKHFEGRPTWVLQYVKGEGQKEEEIRYAASNTKWARELFFQTAYAMSSASRASCSVGLCHGDATFFSVPIVLGKKEDANAVINMLISLVKQAV